MIKSEFVKLPITDWFLTMNQAHSNVKLITDLDLLAITQIYRRKKVEGIYHVI